MASRRNRSSAAASRRSLKCATASPVLVRLPEMNFIDDKDGKPVGINEHIGRRPDRRLRQLRRRPADAGIAQAGSGARFDDARASR